MVDRFTMNNTTFKKVTHKERELFSANITMFLNALYMILSVGGVLNNFIAILVLCRERTLRRPYNMILLNPFVADMIYSLTMQSYIWIDFTEIKQRGKAAGFMCAISIGMIAPMICMTANCMSLVAITVLRYLSIVHNYSGILVTSKNFIIGYCVLSWQTGVVVMMPSALSLKYNHEEAICYRQWPEGVNSTIYSAVTTSVFFLAFLLIMMVFYMKLVLHIWTRSLNSSIRDSVAERTKKSVSVLLGLLILAVIVCWTPLFTIWFVGRTFDYFPKNTDGEFKRQRWLRVAVMFAICNPVLDPLCYAYSSSEYRAGVRKLFRHCTNNRLSPRNDRGGQ